MVTSRRLVTTEIFLCKSGIGLTVFLLLLFLQSGKLLTTLRCCATVAYATSCFVCNETLVYIHVQNTQRKALHTFALNVRLSTATR